ncbi:MAG: OsmC family protein [Chloroflexi bacterium]|nr:OsmC family protein [Chloroflexota bacterium]
MNDRLNGLRPPEIAEALRLVAAQPGAGRAPKTSRVRWLGGFKLKAMVRNHAFVVDEPPHLKGEDEAPNAMEYVLGALGACYATGFILAATMRGIELYNLEVALESTQNNVLTFFGLASDGHSGFEEIRAKLFVQADADEATLREIWEQTVQTSPVGNSLTRTVRVRAELAVVA